MRSVIACLLLAGCGSWHEPAQPLPEIDTPGAFVAVEREGIELYRTLSVFDDVSADAVLFLTLYDVAPASFAEARSIAQRHDIPVQQELMFESKNELTSLPHEVVWFRTLSDEEEERIP